MCRQYLTFYEWCRCEEDSGHTSCASGRSQRCRGVSIETVHMHCFCNTHATTKWVTEEKGFKRDRQQKRRAEQAAGEKTLSSSRKQLLRLQSFRAMVLEKTRRRTRA